MFEILALKMTAQYFRLITQLSMVVFLFLILSVLAAIFPPA